MPVEVLKDRDLLRSFLTRDRVGNAYLLGDLDPAYLPFCDWFGHFNEDRQLDALILLYKGLSLPVVLTVGPPKEDEASRRGLTEIFDAVHGQLPESFWVHTWEHHLGTLDAHFSAGHLNRMIRMGLSRENYRPSNAEVRVRRLDHPDTAAIMALYRYYPDNFFEPYQLESGLYFGVDVDKGRGLAAIAGIHVFSQAYDIAAIGNLVTHPDHRRHGYATAVTTRLLDELFKSVSLVTLNVQEGNMAAIGTYEKFGFTHHHIYHEGRVTRRQNT